jgi:hypothetical protein
MGLKTDKVDFRTLTSWGAHGSMVEAPCYKPEGPGEVIGFFN